MDRQFRTWRTGEGERLWLSMLVGAMEQASLQDRGEFACERSELARLRLQLACPASPRAFGGSAFSLRN
jgi:predicted deacetylase